MQGADAEGGLVQLQLLNAPQRPRIAIGTATIHRLIERASELTGLAPSELYSQCRQRDMSWVRFMVMRVAHERGRSTVSIARALGGMDHTSVMYGIRRAPEIAEHHPEYAELLKLLRREGAQ